MASNVTELDPTVRVGTDTEELRALEAGLDELQSEASHRRRDWGRVALPLGAVVDQIPPHYRSVAKVLGASRFGLALQVVLPAALPGYVAGIKQGWAFSW